MKAPLKMHPISIETFREIIEEGYVYIDKTAHCWAMASKGKSFDLLLFVDKGLTFRNYWFETGNPSFLMELLRRQRMFLPDLEGIDADWRRGT